MSQRPERLLPPGPVLVVAGCSGSGKTTLLEAVIPRLLARGLRVAVVKNDAHGLAVDHPGKDSDRLFRAGAKVVLRGPGEALVRAHRDGGDPLGPMLADLLADHDLVLLEGHRDTPLPKVWLANATEPAPPPGVTGVRAVLEWDGDRVERFLALLDDWLPGAWRGVPVLGGILIGGANARMGAPKQLLRLAGRTFLERVASALAPHVGQVVLLGAGEVPESCRTLPRLADAPDLTGPLAGMLAAMRWAPGHCWLFAACDLPLADESAVGWLIGERRPGRWAVMPATPGGTEPLLALYERQAHALLEGLASRGLLAPVRITSHPKVAVIPSPADLVRCFRNVNAPADLATL